MRTTVITTPLTDREETICDRFGDSMYLLGLFTKSQLLDFRSFTAILQDLYHLLDCRDTGITDE